MNTQRAVVNMVKGRPVTEGAGVHLTRIFPSGEIRQLDPFLLLDEFHSSNPDEYSAGFRSHPHRGMEAITYVLRGTMEHSDSMGSRGVIGPGGVQWMTAGSGIIHQEMPHGDEDGTLWGLQLWANLPAAHKMMTPRYRDIAAEHIPEVELDLGVRVRVICGAVGDVTGPVRDIVIEPQYLDVSVPAGAAFVHRVPAGHTVFAYVLEGKGLFAPGASAGSETLVVYGDGDELSVSAEGDGVRALLVSGKPIGEPVAWRGPVVMNTQEEVRQAFEELDQGTFLKHEPVH